MINTSRIPLPLSTLYSKEEEPSLARKNKKISYVSGLANPAIDSISDSPSKPNSSKHSAFTIALTHLYAPLFAKQSVQGRAKNSAPHKKKRGNYRYLREIRWTYSLPLPLIDEVSSGFSCPELIREREEELSFIAPLKERLMQRFNLFFCVKGKLVQNSKGLLFLELSQAILPSLGKLLKPHDVELPDFFFRGLGAHIPIMLPNETKDRKIKEIGEDFYFSITGCQVSSIFHLPGVKKIWYFSIASPSLEDLRQRYGLTRSLRGHEFISVIGVERGKRTTAPAFRYRINPSESPA